MAEIWQQKYIFLVSLWLCFLFVLEVHLLKRNIFRSLNENEFFLSENITLVKL